MNRLVILIIFSLLFNACGNQSDYEPPANPRFVLVDNVSVGIDFTNTVEDTDSFNVFKYRNFYNGAGVALVDINNDDLLDIFFCANQKENRLYLNKGDWQFEDISNSAGIDDKNGWSTGVAIVDVNGDGWNDIYVCQSGKQYGDVSKNKLFINQHNLTFIEQAKEFGLDDMGLSTHAAFFDYDLDGDLDCYVLNNSLQAVSNFELSEHERNIIDNRGGDKLYRNDDNKFVNVTQQSGIYSNQFGFGLGISIGDFNQDGYPDLYVSNDFFERDYLYINQQDGTFKDDISHQMGHISLASMGSDLADINNDGLVDLFTTEMLPPDNYREKTSIKFEDYDIARLKASKSLHHQLIQNTLQLNNGNGTFSEIAGYAGVLATDWSWSALITDLDNDGWKDIYVSNGIYKDLNNQDFIKFFASRNMLEHVIKKEKFDYKELQEKIESVKIANYAFINGKNFIFKDRAKEMGLAYASFSNGSTYGDIDNDGDIDLIVNNINQAPFIFKNHSRELYPETSNYIKVQLHNDEPKNIDAWGSKVIIYHNQQKQFFELSHARGFQSSISSEIIVGLGKKTMVDSLEVKWIGGGISMLKNLKVNRSYIVEKKNPILSSSAPENTKNTPWLKKTEGVIHDSFSFTEDAYVDFDVERLMPQMLSQEGIRFNVNDINGDQLEDVLITTPANNSTTLFLQDRNGKLNYQPIVAFENDKALEGVASAIADFNGDGNKDIVVAYGGNKYNIYNIKPRPILYLQTNNNKFIVAPNAFQDSIRLNASSISYQDIDNDGDQDLLITGRSIPGEYGASPSLYVLQNDGKGNFDDITYNSAKAIAQIGMVTQSLFVNVDEEPTPELILVGDWFPITICAWQDGQFNIIKQLPYAGFISALQVKDINGDKLPELLIGNYGLNNKFNVSPERPLEILLNDFDNNGQRECFIAYYKSDGNSYPLHQHDDLIAQLPSLQKRFLKYKDYAMQTSNTIFDENIYQSSVRKTIDHLASGVLHNEGNFNFTFKPFPAQAQFSPIRAICIDDVNEDNHIDLIAHGNLYGIKPELGRYDATYGNVMTYQDDKWQIVPYKQSGFFIKGEVKDIAKITLGNKPFYLVALGNGKINVFGRP